MKFKIPYEGIIRGYPKIRKYFGRLADYLALARPFTLLAPFLVGIFGSAICLGSAFLASWAKVVYVALTLALCQAVGQVFNQAVGVGEDTINKPYRPIPRGEISVNEAYGVGVLLIIVSLGRAVTITLAFGFWALILIFFAVFYSMKPIEARKYFGVNLVWMAVSRGLLPLVMIWSAYASPFVAKPWAIGCLAFFWVLAWQPTKDLMDVEGDEAFGIPTLPVRYGAKKTKEYILSMSMVPWFWLLVFLATEILPATYVWLLLLIFLELVGLWGFDKEFAFVENNLSWMVFYLGLGMIFVLSFIAEVL